MAGERDLETLLASLAPTLLGGEYVFVTLPNGRYGDGANLEPIASMAEREGLSLLVPKARADEHDVSYEGVFRRITLGVHSDLEAVGLTAAVATALAEAGISANVIAGHFHDHILVPSSLAPAAIALIQELD